jgi:hypothetical protein
MEAVMTGVELKRRLIRKINRMKNDFLLQEIYRMVENEESDSDIYQFSEDELNAINEARNQYLKGKYLDSDEADKEIDAWIWDSRQNPKKIDSTIE